MLPFDPHVEQLIHAQFFRFHSIAHVAGNKMEHPRIESGK